MKRIAMLLSAALAVTALITGCAPVGDMRPGDGQIDGLTYSGRDDNIYAEQFTIDRYEEGCSLISTPDGRYLIADEGSDIPSDIADDIKILEAPVDKIYIAGTSVMEMFDELDSLDAVAYSSQRAQDWNIENAVEAMNKGDILYAGKYSAPDYELLTSNKCHLAIESTMIDHTPDVKEKLEELDITVFTDYSSYESHPLARCEWIKVYGEMLGKQEEAARLFDKQAEMIGRIDNRATGKSVAFFYINGNGQFIVRRPGDYISKIIELAGGKNVFADVGSDTSSSTVTLDDEDFYLRAQNADILIYNSNMGGEIQAVSELADRNELIGDLKAVRTGNVWAVSSNLYQHPMGCGEMVSEINQILLSADGNGADGMKFLYKLKGGGSVDR